VSSFTGGDRALTNRALPLSVLPGNQDYRGGDRSLNDRFQQVVTPFPGAIGVNGNFLITTTNENYFTLSNGIVLRASVSTPSDGKTSRRGLLAIHGGGFTTGNVQSNVSQDAGKWGFLGVACEYRLAPPHVEMNTPTHPAPGQNTVGDDGHYPEQTQDIVNMIRTLRADPRCNGEVVVVGGSSGGAHGLLMAAQGKKGDDRPDLLVALSTGISNFFDPNSWDLNCVGGGTCPHSAVASYLNISDTFPSLPSGADLASATLASPISYVNTSMCPCWFLLSNMDGLGIPTSLGYSIFSFRKDNNQPNVLENGVNGLIPKLYQIGVPESFTSWPEPGSFKQTLVQVSVYSHSFDYWDQMKSQLLPWLSGIIPP
jgi:acetyl esterase/lipase